MSLVNRLLFWSDIGAVCKIEYSRLDGTQRANFLDVGLAKPLGMTIDYANDRLYWVDDFLGTIERVDIATASNRGTIQLSDFGIAQPKLFGIALYKVDGVTPICVHSVCRKLADGRDHLARSCSEYPIT